MKILLIGLGRFGGEIAKRLLSQNHQLVIIENNTEIIERFIKNFPQGDYKICVGDATSFVIWEYLPLEEFDLIISSLRSGEFNRVICQFIREFFKNFDVPVVVYVSDNRYEDYFANFNCKTFYLPELAATFIEGLTLKGINKPIGIGLGKNEILEAVLSPKSPYVDTTINLNKHIHWRIALVYRGEEIILPRKKIKLKAGDRVVLVGDNPKIVLEIAKSMALGTPQFPLSFGENLMAVLRRNELHYLREYYYLWKHSRLKQVILYSDVKDRSKLEAVVGDRKFLNENLILEKGKNYNTVFKKELQLEHSTGLISTPYKKRFLLFHNVDLRKFFHQEIPFLIPKLSFPYSRILVSLNSEQPSGIIEQCFELAQLVRAEKLDFIYVSLPEVLTSDREKKKINRVFDLIEYYSKLFGLKDRVSVIRKEGNPLKKTLKVLKNYNLLVVGFEPEKLSILEPYTPYLLTKSSPKSVLGIPSGG